MSDKQNVFLKIGNVVKGTIRKGAEVTHEEEVSLPPPEIPTEIGNNVGGDIEGKVRYASKVRILETTKPASALPEEPQSSKCVDATPFSNGFSGVKRENINAKPSHMVIFNQQTFDLESYRGGSDNDVEALKNTFAPFGVIPVVRHNFSVQEIQQEIITLSTTDFSNYKLFMLVIMTHGLENGIVYARDRSFHLRNTIIDRIIENRTLNGIPKIFVVVACRGDNHYYQSDAILSAKNGLDYSSCLICYSTYEGHLSMRDTRTGTMYIQELCRLIRENQSADIHSILAKLKTVLNVGNIQVAYDESTLGSFYLRSLIE